MTHDDLDYIDIIRSNGARVTYQRMLVLDAICEGKGHTTHGEIYARMKIMDSSIDRSTLYRALEFFTGLGLVVSADIGIGEKVYEITKPESHHHLVCQGCGNMQVINPQSVQSLFKVLEGQHDFTINMDHLVIFGKCFTCR